MNWQDAKDIAATILYFSVICLVIYIAVCGVTDEWHSEKLKQQAVEHGFGRWEVSASGKEFFVWEAARAEGTKP